MRNPKSTSLGPRPIFRSFGVILLAIAVLVGVASASPHALGQESADETPTDAGRYRTVTLEPGWNLVSWSGASPIEEALQSLDRPVDAVFAFNAASQTFDSFDPTGPSFLNNLEDLEFGDGLWVRASERVNWFQSDDRFQHAVDLLPGFNLVAWMGPSRTPISEALNAIGSEVNLAATYDAQRQAFLTWSPDVPAFLNDLETLDYGQGLWLDVRAHIRWDQPKSPEFGTQDVWFMRNIRSVNADGVVSDLSSRLVDAATQELGRPISMRLGMTFQETGRFAATALDDVGRPIENVALSVGVVTRGTILADGSTTSNDASAFFFGEFDQMLAIISTARLDQARRNLSEIDQVTLELDGAFGLTEGDTLVLDAIFAQTLAPDDPRVEDGETALGIFERRWNVGAVQILGVETDSGVRLPAVATNLSMTGTTAATVSVAQLEPKIARWGAKDAPVRLATTPVLDLEPSALAAARAIEFFPTMQVATAAEAMAANEAGTGEVGDPPAPDLPPRRGDQIPPQVALEILDQSSNEERGYLAIAIDATDDGSIADIELIVGTESFYEDGPAGPSGTSLGDSSPTSSRRTTKYDFVNRSTSPIELFVSVHVTDAWGNTTDQSHTLTIPPRDFRMAVIGNEPHNRSRLIDDYPPRLVRVVVFELTIAEGGPKPADGASVEVIIKAPFGEMISHGMVDEHGAVSFETGGPAGLYELDVISITKHGVLRVVDGSEMYAHSEIVVP